MKEQQFLGEVQAAAGLSTRRRPSGRAGDFEAKVPRDVAALLEAA